MTPDPDVMASINPESRLPEERARPDFRRFVAVDTETTGLDPDHGEIIEIGAARFVDGMEVDSFVTFIKPDRGLPERNRRLTGIDPSRLTDAPSIATALEQFRAFIGDDLLVLHNANFDLKFLAHYAARLGLSQLVNPALCTQHLAALIEPNAGTLQLGLLSEHWGITITDSHRALQDARSAGLLALRLIEELRTWPPIFLSHLAGYRGKSVDPLFDLLEHLSGDPAVSSSDWRLDREIRSRLSTAQSDSIPGFPAIATYAKSEQDSQPDPVLRQEALEGLMRSGLSLIEDLRPGSGHPIDSILSGTLPVPRLVVGVLEEDTVRRILGSSWDKDGISDILQACYLGRSSEYVCLRRAFDESGKPVGWIELSPFERVVLARWLASTWSGRVSRLSWWLLNNFTGLKGHLHSLCCSDFDCLGCQSSYDGPCFAEMALQRADKASCVLVKQHYFFGAARCDVRTQSTLLPVPACLIEQADQLVQSGREARTEELDLDSVVRRIKALANDAAL